MILKLKGDEAGNQFKERTEKARRAHGFKSTLQTTTGAGDAIEEVRRRPELRDEDTD